MITQNSIEQLLNVVSIEDVVGDFVSLKRSGARYKGCCPFHDEKTPSFVVSPSIGIYKCFGCQKGGNAIQFMMDIENLNFVEAARSLAKRFGVELEETHIENRDAHQEAHQKMLTLAKGLVEGMGGTVEFDIRRGYPFLKNNEELTERLQSEAKAFLGDQNVEPLGIWMAAEDFSYFTQEVPSCFYRLGTRNEAKKTTFSVHHPSFDVDEDALERGCGLMAFLAISELKR